MKGFCLIVNCQQGEYLMASRNAVVFLGKDARTPEKPLY